MSLRREVLIRILALLQRKTLLKTKNRTSKCKCLKRHYSTVQSMRNVGVDGGRGFCPLFSSPPRGIWQLNSPHPRPLPFKAKKLLMPGGQPGGRLGAAGIDWCIIYATFAAALSLQISLIVRFDSNVKKETFRCQFSMQKFKLKSLRKESLKKIQACTGLAFDHALSLYLFFFFLSSQRSKEAKKSSTWSQVSTGFEPLTSAIPVQRYTNWPLQKGGNRLILKAFRRYSKLLESVEESWKRREKGLRGLQSTDFCRVHRKVLTWVLKYRWCFDYPKAD